MRRDFSSSPRPEPQGTPPLAVKISPYSCQRRTTLNNCNHRFTVTGLPNAGANAGLRPLPVDLQIGNFSEKLGKFSPHSPTSPPPKPDLRFFFVSRMGLFLSRKWTNIFRLYSLEMVGYCSLRAVIVGHNTCKRQIF